MEDYDHEEQHLVNSENLSEENLINDVSYRRLLVHLISNLLNHLTEHTNEIRLREVRRLRNFFSIPWVSQELKLSLTDESGEVDIVIRNFLKFYLLRSFLNDFLELSNQSIMQCYRLIIIMAVIAGGCRILIVTQALILDG